MSEQWEYNDISGNRVGAFIVDLYRDPSLWKLRIENYTPT